MDPLDPEVLRHLQDRSVRGHLVDPVVRQHQMDSLFVREM